MIKLARPEIGAAEIDAVARVLETGMLVEGVNVAAFETAVGRYTGARHAIAVSSGTAALHLALVAVGVGPGDEVIVPGFTFPASANVIELAGAVPVLVDIDLATFNLDPAALERLVTPRTRAIMPVHLFGQSAEMDVVAAVARAHGLKVVEDAACALGARYRGRACGALSDAGCFSFHPRKVITTGEGGMVLTDDDKLAERLRLLRNLGFSKPRFYHEVPAFNFRMTGYQAAMGLAQFRKIDHILSEKRRIAVTYNHYLSDINGLQLPYEANWARNVYWMYGVVVHPDFGISRDDLMQQLHEAGIDTRTFFCPMNQQPCLQSRPGFREVPCPIADGLWQKGLYLPSTYTLSEDAIKQIADTVRLAHRN